MTSDEQQAREQRQELRLGSDDTVFVEVAQDLGADGLESRIAICEVLDISANGLRVGMDEELTVGSIHQICVQAADDDNRLYLTAEVKWLKPDNDYGLQVGFALFESEDTDIEQWKQLIIRRIQ